MSARIPEDIETQIVEGARNGKTGRELAQIFGISPSAVSNIFRRYNITVPKGRPRSCELDETAFDIPSSTRNYWMGFLITDGTVADYGYGTPEIIFDIAEKDRTQLEKFRTFLKSTHAISNITHKTPTPDAVKDDYTRRSVAFRVRSQKLYDAVVRLGMTKKGPERTAVAELEDSIDFWRGCIDGDGTVRWTTDRNGYTYPQLILCGHMPLLEKFQAFLMRRGVISNVTDTASGIYQIRIIGSGAYKAIRDLYENAVTALDRKLETARDIINKQDRF